MTSPSEHEHTSGTAVLVTGATGDIGQAIVSRLVSTGVSVFCAGRDDDRLAALVAQHGDAVIPLCYDVCDEAAVKTAFRTLQQTLSAMPACSLSGLVNCAGMMKESALAVTSRAMLQAHLDVNYLAAYQHMQLASRLMMKARSGSIVNVVSQVGELGSAGMSAYAASKAALTGATYSLAKELAAVGIRVNAVSPGFIDTSLTRHYDQSAREKVLSRIAMRHAGRAEDVANAVQYLLSDQSAYITGQVLSVDGMFCP
ncbi:SDR family NAD(P)-dependent oxidoreductase [Alteromonas sp. CYL-A6]|uniref:SDR family NAD(P)-dependent oxidoreductase n=1 Tax=Alteromonas nitratireducens TaxID=3390813 RepID=UPI0034A7C952